MNIKEQIKQYIASQPEPKRSDMQALHRIILQVMPACKLYVRLRDAIYFKQFFKRLDSVCGWILKIKQTLSVPANLKGNSRIYTKSAVLPAANLLRRA